MTNGDLGLEPGQAGDSQPSEGGRPALSLSAQARRRGMHRLLLSLPGILSLVAAIIAWQVIAKIVANPLFFPDLGAVWDAGVALVKSGEIFHHIRVSGQELVVGYAIGAVLGVVLGSILAINAWAARICGPWVSFLYATPTLALAPLFILWLGVGIVSKIGVVILMVVFPVLLNTQQGLSTAEATHIDMGRAYGASKTHVLFKIQLPNAIPYVLVGLRLAVGKGLIGVVVGEMFGASAGLGYLVLESANTFNSPRLFIGVIILGLAGAAGTELLMLLERRIAPWRFGR
jgi:NitT/TauT family transport system permease protein